MANAVDSSSSSSSCGPQDTSYIQIRVLGRGAFGEAVLYRKTEDNSLVVWKEIELSRLSERERRDAQTEIDILALLNHANIVTYYNHFLDKETLLIEMEYANGGSLYHKIALQPEDQLFEEELIVWYLYQLVSAVAHIHELGIIHRDIKTLNIFLTKAGLIKLGDFGISKVLDSQAEKAHSYVGTPYYMSPELISGKEYNAKTDMWAVGCVLHELCSLTRTFDASNPLRLAAEIVRGEFAALHQGYSQDLKDVVSVLLNKDPAARLTAVQVLDSSLLAPKMSEMEKQVWELNSSTRRARALASQSSLVESSPVVTSKSCETYFWGGGKSLPNKLDIFKGGKCALKVSAGHSHFAVVTVEKEVFTWASSQGNTEMCGQLGHSDTALYKSPKKVSALEGISIREASCGEDFTACVTDEGKVYTFGSDYFGCLGCDGELGDEVTVPTIVDFFTSRPVQHLSCGFNHVLALTNNGEVYSWGSGEFGRLGLGSEDDYSLPQLVQLPRTHAVIRQCCASQDGSFLITMNGRLLACGSNEYNKLGFNCSATGLRKRQVKVSFDIPCKYSFAVVKPLNRYHISDISAGHTHSAVITAYGQLITFGSNQYGQLGVGDFKKRNGINLITGIMSGRRVERIGCGDGFTVVATSDKHIYSWGNGENGRLGFVDQTGGPNGVSTARPRPIFGALHDVSDLSCSFWHTLIVAEKVLSQKTICSPRSGNSFTSTNESSSEDAFTDASEIEYGASDDQDSGIAGKSVFGQSSVPDWLKAELEDAEIIPVNKSTEKDECLEIQPPPISQQSLEEKEECEDDYVQSLKDRIEELENENSKLRSVVDEQAKRIEELEELNSPSGLSA